MRPGGNYVMLDLDNIGGIPVILKYYLIRPPGRGLRPGSWAPGCRSAGGRPRSAPPEPRLVPPADTSPFSQSVLLDPSVDREVELVAEVLGVGVVRGRGQRVAELEAARVADAEFHAVHGVARSHVPRPRSPRWLSLPGW